MNLVFSTHDVPAPQRHLAWQEALCSLYVRVDTRCDAPDDYMGFVKEGRFGDVTITDTLLAPQEIRRRPTHLTNVDKDCLYVALTQKGQQMLEQNGRTVSYGVGQAGLMSASEPYMLRNTEAHRAFYLEIPRQAMVSRCGAAKTLNPLVVNTSYGLGRILTGLCGSMVVEAATVTERARAPLGEKLMDLLALALDDGGTEASLGESVAREEKLRQVKMFIDANIGNPLLNPERVAVANQMSVRALHYVFKNTEQSVSEYIWDRRLERCRKELQMPSMLSRSVTDIALASGFNSMSHFSSAFRRKFGISPSNARAPTLN